MHERKLSFIEQILLPASSWQVFLVVSLFIVVGSLLYSNSLYNAFQFDDLIGMVQDAPKMDLSQLGAVLGGGTSRSVTFATFILGFAWHGDWLPGYHLINIAIHILASIGVFLLLSRLLVIFKLKKISTRQIFFMSLAGGLLFLVHPIQTQPVNYISQRLALLAGCFYIYSCWFFTLYLESKKIVSKLLFLFAVVVSAILAFLSKENAFTLPLMLNLIDVFSKQVSRDVFIKKSLFWLVSAAVIAFGFYISRYGLDTIFSTELAPTGQTITPFTYGLTQITVIPRYLQLLIAPINLSLDHDVPLVTSTFSRDFLIGAAVLGSLLFAVYRFFRQDKVVLFGVLWFFVTLSIESSIIPIADVMFEHRLYLPSVGFFLIFAYGLSNIFAKTTRPYVLRSILLVLILTSFSFITFQRNKVWQTPTLLWQDVVNKYPNLARAHYNLGFALADDELSIFEAIGHFEKAIAIQPEHSKARNALGFLYLVVGKYDEAVLELDIATQLDPDNQLYKENLDIAVHEKLRADQHKNQK